MKRNLANILRQRTETIEYRAIRKQLMVAAQNRQNTYRIMRISEPTILMLQNEGVTVEMIEEYGTKKYLLTW